MSEGTPGDHGKADEEGKSSQEEKEGEEEKRAGIKKGESSSSELKSWTHLGGDGLREEVVKSTVVASSSSTAASMAHSSLAGRKYQISSIGNSAEDVDLELEEYSEDDTEVSSEAVVDDIELILMPEEVEDLPAMDHSPKLVRVTELNIDGKYGNMEEDFFKMDEEDEELEEEEEEEEEECGDDGNITEKEPEDQDDPQSQDYEEEDETTENGNSRQRRLSSGDVHSNRKVHSGVQTDISVLEKDDGGDYDDGEDASYSEDSSRFDWRRRKTLTLTGVGIAGAGKPSTGRLGTPRGKKLNWKSELTLLPSKTKIGFGAGGTGLSMGGSTGFGAFSFANSGYSGDANYSSQDPYSPRVAKFTSQDNVMSSSSQFLKPSTLYRTRNLSRNLNHFASSENTFMQQEQLDSPRLQASTTALCTSTNFRGSSSQSSNQIFMAAPLSARRRPSAKNFRQSLPDLSSSGVISYQDNNRRRQSQFGGSRSGGGGGGRVNFGFRLQKKSSSDDETSSLIDESERCLRSSIDLLLTDDYPSPGCDYPYMPRSSGGGAGGFSQPSYAASNASGYYSARRSCSQPLLTDQGLCGEARDPSMGSPFLPRTLKEMRCSRWAKVILPNGLVAVVSVKEMDELRDSLTVHTETGCVVTIPFRKVVFAWRLKR